MSFPVNNNNKLNIFSPRTDTEVAKITESQKRITDIVREARSMEPTPNRTGNIASPTYPPKRPATALPPLMTPPRSSNVTSACSPAPSEESSFSLARSPKIKNLTEWGLVRPEPSRPKGSYLGIGERAATPTQSDDELDNRYARKRELSDTEESPRSQQGAKRTSHNTSVDPIALLAALKPENIRREKGNSNLLKLPPIEKGWVTSDDRQNTSNDMDTN